MIGARSSPAATAPAPAPGIERWAAAAVLLPAVLWFGSAVLRDPGPAWRAEYRGTRDWTGPSELTRERQVERYWDRFTPHVPGGFDVRAFSVRYETCLELDRPLVVPFMLVSTGIARFTLDGRERLSAAGERARVTRGEVIELEPGIHHLQVDFSSRGWPAIGLYAAFGSEPPSELPPRETVAGVSFRSPAPGVQGAGACSKR